ncbi:MAG: dTDP-4-dehydrorhamnose reductase [Bacteroidota bacterium]
MRVLIPGANGQVGRELVARAAQHGVEAIGLTRADLDLADANAVRAVVQAHQPDAVVNAAAYTAVDRAESEPDLAFAVNRDGPAALAAVCTDLGIPLVHFSTDYVFDGTKPEPYVEGDPAAPLGVYGQSKWEGEEAVRAALDRHLVLRVSWVFSRHGGNFVKTMLRLGREREALRIVADQHGGPTPASAIADAALVALRRAAERDDDWGTYHFCGAPFTTWHGFAEAIFGEARRHEALAVRDVAPIPASAYPTPAARPSNSRMDTARLARTFGITPADWRAALARVIAALQPSVSDEAPG